MAVTKGFGSAAGVVPLCRVCGKPFRRVGRRLHCSDVCRQRAHRARRAQALVVAAAAPRVPVGGRRAVTVYVCPSCETRQLGVQRCEECGLFGVAAGIGGACPCCGESVAAAELVEG